MISPYPLEESLFLIMDEEYRGHLHSSKPSC